jgi:hypothetical protein
MVSDRYQAQWIHKVDPSKVIVIATASIQASGGFWPMFDRLKSMCKSPPSPEWEPQIIDELSPRFVDNKT